MLRWTLMVVVAIDLTVFDTFARVTAVIMLCNVQPTTVVSNFKDNVVIGGFYC